MPRPIVSVQITLHHYHHHAQDCSSGDSLKYLVYMEEAKRGTRHGRKLIEISPLSASMISLVCVIRSSIITPVCLLRYIFFGKLIAVAYRSIRFPFNILKHPYTA